MLMECGAESAMNLVTGVLTMLELCVVKWGCLIKYYYYRDYIMLGSFILDYELGISERDPVIGSVNFFFWI